MSKRWKSSHPSCSDLPPSPSPDDLLAFLDQADDLRRALWSLVASSQSTRCRDSARRVRDALGDLSEPVHELRRCLERQAIVQLVRPPADE